jgi:hypothetical protein
MVASPPFDKDDDSTDSDKGPPDPVDTENSPPTPFPNCKGEPVFKLMEPLVMPSLGVLIITSPDTDDALIPEDSKMEPPWSLTPLPAIPMIEPPDVLPAPEDNEMSHPDPA